MTFEDYIRNPVKKSSSTIPMKEMFEKAYKEKFDALIAREAGKVKFHLCHEKDDKRYVMHVLIPSEEVPGFVYDTVVEFITDDNVLSQAQTLTNYDVRFYSNDPSFMFTYAYAFNKADMFIPMLKSKALDRCLSERPKERNPYAQTGYVKSLYFAYLFYKWKGLNYKSAWLAYPNITFKDIARSIMEASIKIAHREEEGKRVRRARAKERKKLTNQIKNSNYHDRNIKTSARVTTTGRTSSVKKSSTIKTISRTKRK